jgi:hypothetical protein
MFLNVGRETKNHILDQRDMAVIAWRLKHFLTHIIINLTQYLPERTYVECTVHYITLEWNGTRKNMHVYKDLTLCSLYTQVIRMHACLFVCHPCCMPLLLLLFVGYPTKTSYSTSQPTVIPSPFRKTGKEKKKKYTDT